MNTEISQEELWVWTPGRSIPEHTRRLPEHLFLKLFKATDDFKSVQDEIREYFREIDE